jgi:uncharacterized membrane protein
MAKSLQRRLRGYVSGVEGALAGKPKWRTKPGTIAAIVLLILISVGQLLRVIFHVNVMANGIVIPLWPSGIACVVAVILAVMLWRESGL